MGKPEGKNLRRRRGRWDDNIKMVVQDGQAWTELIWLRYRDRWRALVNAAMNLRVP